MVNEARSIARTSSRSPARIRSTERGGTTPKLRLGGSQVEWRQLGGADAVAESEPLASQHGHARRGGHAARGRQVANVRRVHAGGAVAHQQGRLAETPGQLSWRQRKVVPLATQPVAIVAIARGVHLATPRLEHGAHGQRRPWHRGSHGVERGDRKSTRLNSSHLVISYAVFCLKKK